MDSMCLLHFVATQNRIFIIKKMVSGEVLGEGQTRKTWDIGSDRLPSEKAKCKFISFAIIWLSFDTTTKIFQISPRAGLILKCD